MPVLEGLPTHDKYVPTTIKATARQHTQLGRLLASQREEAFTAYT